MWGSKWICPKPFHLCNFHSSTNYIILIRQFSLFSGRRCATGDGFGQHQRRYGQLGVPTFRRDARDPTYRFQKRKSPSRSVSFFSLCVYIYMYILFAPFYIHIHTHTSTMALCSSRHSADGTTGGPPDGNVPAGRFNFYPAANAIFDADSG